MTQQVRDLLCQPVLTANGAIGGATDRSGKEASAEPAERHGQGRVLVALAARTYNVRTCDDFQSKGNSVNRKFSHYDDPPEIPM